MIIESYLPFVLATSLILIIPGPTIILVIRQAVAHGRRSVVPLVAGVLLGDFTAMMLSLLGLGASIICFCSPIWRFQMDWSTLSILSWDKIVESKSTKTIC